MYILTGHLVFLIAKSDSLTYRNVTRFYEMVSFNSGIAKVVFLLKDYVGCLVLFIGGMGTYTGED